MPDKSKATKSHAKKVELCISEITKELDKANFKNTRKDFIDKMVNLTIKDKCSLYGLKMANIKMILFGRFEPEKKKVIAFNSY